MNSQSKNKPTRLFVTSVCVLVILLCLIGAGAIWHNKQNSSQLTYTQLPMSHGKDIRRAMVGLDQMGDICAKRLIQESRDCRKAHIPANEAIKRMDAVHNAGQAEMDRVIASHYAKTFDPTVMDKAAQAASKE